MSVKCCPHRRCHRRLYCVGRCSEVRQWLPHCPSLVPQAGPGWREVGTPALWPAADSVGHAGRPQDTTDKLAKKSRNKTMAKTS
ncbi:hypothetical protein E2C01_020399 [Portunus trituberculatus]|uniref:Uncharacterized protein n=1 Tax=Portunus trituberculatus TaxID=210409 RepID=A0A5B7DZN5_PORTR|nr:hypothetical protein [Portunus trituberculatus]